MKENLDFAEAACRYAIGQGCTPVAVHLIYPQLLDDSIPEEREVGLNMGLRVLAACDELWLCGERISAGMQAELEEAKRLGIPVYHVAEQKIRMIQPRLEMEMCLC